MNSLLFGVLYVFASSTYSFNVTFVGIEEKSSQCLEYTWTDFECVDFLISALEKKPESPVNIRERIFSKFDCERKEVTKSGQIEIQHNVTIKGVNPTSLNMGSGNSDVLKIDFAFLSKSS